MEFLYTDCTDFTDFAEIIQGEIRGIRAIRVQKSFLTYSGTSLLNDQ